MLHQSLPLYEGNQPFIYACYCAEDDDVAFPVLARMYNEGFRIWCARAGGISTDFRTIQRMNASASIMLFVSHNMMEMLRSGDPEVVAAAKSPRLRIIVSIDGTDPDKDTWALAVPDKLQYSVGNDAAFWLYMYSSDQLEKCRGPWPEKKINIRELTFDDFREEAIQAEYKKLESIIRSDGSEVVVPDINDLKEYDDRFADPAGKRSERYPNNPGYIEPKPDEYSYEPLEIIDAAKSEGEKEFDAFIGYLDQCVVDTDTNAQKAADTLSSHLSSMNAALTNDSASTGSKVSAYSQSLITPESLSPEARRRRMYENGRLGKVLDPNDIDALVQRKRNAARQQAEEERLKAEEERIKNDEARQKLAAERQDLNDERQKLEEALAVKQRELMEEQDKLDQKAALAEKRLEEKAAELAEKLAEKRIESLTAEDGSHIEFVVDGTDQSIDEQTESAEIEDTEPAPSVIDTAAAVIDDLPAAEEQSAEENRAAAPAAAADIPTVVATEELLEKLLESGGFSDPSAPHIPTPEELAKAPTYIMLPPSGGSASDAPICLKLIYENDRMIAVPAETPGYLRGETDEPAPRAESSIISRLSPFGQSGDIVDESDADDEPEPVAEPAPTVQKLTTVRKIIKHRQTSVKVTPVKCEVIHMQPDVSEKQAKMQSVPAAAQQSLRVEPKVNINTHMSLSEFILQAAQDAVAARIPAPAPATSVIRTPMTSSSAAASAAASEEQPQTMRKNRHRPVVTTTTTEIIENVQISDLRSGNSADPMLEELEPRASHRKNRHPHSDTGLLANVMAALRRDRSELQVVTYETVEEPSVQPEPIAQIEPVAPTPIEIQEPVVAAPVEIVRPVSSLSMAVEKFVELSPAAAGGRK